MSFDDYLCLKLKENVVENNDIMLEIDELFFKFLTTVQKIQTILNDAQRWNNPIAENGAPRFIHRNDERNLVVLPYNQEVYEKLQQLEDLFRQCKENANSNRYSKVPNGIKSITFSNNDKKIVFTYPTDHQHHRLFPMITSVQIQNMVINGCSIRKNESTHNQLYNRRLSDNDNYPLEQMLNLIKNSIRSHSMMYGTIIDKQLSYMRMLDTVSSNDKCIFLYITLSPIWIR